MKIIRTALLTMAASALMATQLWGADVSTPLEPGKPAGVHQAQSGSPNLLLAVGLAAVVAGAVVIATATSGNNSCSSCTTTLSTATTS